MDETSGSARFTRRGLLKAGGLGALAVTGAGALPGVARALSRTRAVTSSVLAAPAVRTDIHLAVTDGYIQLPGRGSGSGNPIYMFGFVRVPVGATPNEMDVYKGAVQFPAPIIGVDQESDVYIVLTNIGLTVRPDLDDSHTIHWHGFPNATAIFDGVPEVSIAVPVGRAFPYYYNPHRTGTFMYHCHFEDVEHVQMGMQGSVFVRPSGSPTQAYADPSTAFDRQFTLLLDEIWTRAHDNLESIQESVWPDYEPNFWTINGRSYPDTLLPNNDGSLPAQPLSSLIQANAGEQVLLRFANLGYQQQSMQLPGIPMRVVGEDASSLGDGALDLSYLTNTVYVGPGEARDVLITAPDFDVTRAEVDGARLYNTYWLRNRDIHRLTNGGGAGLGGQVTQVRVYDPLTPVPGQAHANETYPEDPPSDPYLDPWIV